ncbi:aerotaxis receptor Aer [Cutibacterium sp.]|uniref:aerotaxis receptor Aer n=1 Tax=Cutibacterium sp. TaxID=1912221 RepID=UPI0026DC89CD|nr:aerotaxis receptor Aer [Cutibacterium sp.]MDO4412249.1 aerotaxis receptor Aer [Cutibacterium sp.]
MSRPEPTGENRVVQPEEIFFSTTDSRGVIEKANSVFVDISRYSWDDLIGAPHNIIRHPMMPGAAFLAMWTTIQSGQPFCAYVHNLAADGATYTVLATIVPLGEGYLSVRVTPQVPEMLQAAETVYQAGRDAEWIAGEHGCGAPERARRGLDAVQTALEQSGYPDYGSFMRKALVQEVAVRRQQHHASHGMADDTALGQLSNQVNRARELVETWLSTFDGLSDLSAKAGRTARTLREAMTESQRTADAITDSREATEVSLKPLVTVLGLWTRMDAEIEPLVTGVVADLDAMAISADLTSFRLAVAYIQVESTHSFVSELWAKVDGWEHALPAINDLSRAVEEAMVEANRRLDEVRDLADRAASRIQELADLMAMPTALLTSWQQMASQRELSAGVADLVPRVEEQIGASRAMAAELTDVVGGLHKLMDASSKELNVSVLAEIRRLSAAVAAGN